MNKPKPTLLQWKKHSCSTQKQELSFSRFLLLRLEFEKEPRLCGSAIRRARSHCEKLGFSSLWKQLSSKGETGWSHSLLFPRKQAGVKVLRKQQQQQRLCHYTSFHCGKRQQTSGSGLNVQSHLLLSYEKGSASQWRPQLFPPWLPSAFPSHFWAMVVLGKVGMIARSPYNSACIVFACFCQPKFIPDKKTWAQKSACHISNTDFCIFWP